MSTNAKEHKARVLNKKKKAGTLKRSNRAYNRCPICGRSRGYLRYFKMCRICFRDMAHKGEVPGVKKASW